MEVERLNPPCTDDVLNLLHDLWRYRLENLSDYFLMQFGVATHGYSPAFLRIAQMKDGTIYPENIGHTFARVWVIESDQLVEAPLGHQARKWYDMDLTGKFYVTPSWLFVHEDIKLLLSERYEASLKHRSLGTISFLNGRWHAEWSTRWDTFHFKSNRN
jgi:hypothetical protein